MKRYVCIIVMLVILLSGMSVDTHASQTDVEILYFADGSYATIEIITVESRASGSITASKPYTYYNSDGVMQWKAVLKGTFTYTGTSATCTSATMDTTIYDSSWYTISRSASKSGNMATGTASIGERISNITINRVPVSLTLSCSNNGSVS